jgi:hypothetical protein
MAALDLGLDGSAEKRSQPVAGKLNHRRRALRRKIAAEISSDIDQMQARAGNIGKQGRSLPVR